MGGDHLWLCDRAALGLRVQFICEFNWQSAYRAVERYLDARL